MAMGVPVVVPAVVVPAVVVAAVLVRVVLRRTVVVAVGVVAVLVPVGPFRVHPTILPGPGVGGSDRWVPRARPAYATLGRPGTRPAGGFDGTPPRLEAGRASRSTWWRAADLMDADEFEARQRAREYFHGLRVLPGAWTVVRLDGRGFSRFTERLFDKPFDPRFSDLMVGTAQSLLTELGGRYAYTESDEISLLLEPGFELFGRSVEKLVSICAGIASAAFTHAAGEAAVFDARLWLGVSVPDVVDYFSWRQSDAARCALNGWCYWTLRNSGQSAQQATRSLEGITTADKNELLYGHGVNVNELPTWQRRGIGLWWETYQRAGYDPVRRVEVTATRRRIRVDRELPMKDTYRGLVEQLVAKRI
jgi:tRNA(His) guanylyltransferase